MSNTTAPFTPYIGESIFSNTAGAPFLIFVGLNGVLLVLTLIAIIVMIHQHDRHMKKINAVRGFHQNDIAQGNEILKNLERDQSASLESGGGRKFSTSARSNSIATSGSLQLNTVNNSKKRVSQSGGNVNNIASQQQQQQQRPNRLIYDFHHTPPQPELTIADSGRMDQHRQQQNPRGASFDFDSPDSSVNRIGNNNGGMPRLDLGAIGGGGSLRMDNRSGNGHGHDDNDDDVGVPLSLSSPASSGSFSKSKRGVGMDSINRRRN